MSIEHTLLSHSKVVAKMRPLQREVAERLIPEVSAGRAPASLRDIQQRYLSFLGAPFYFDNGKGWRGEIREAAIDCLIKNGFAKAHTVKANWETRELSDWTLNKADLQEAANLEILFGGNVRLSEARRAAFEAVRVEGEGDEFVYVYTDSLLSELNYDCCKIGRHNSSEKSAVLGRVFEQYGTGNPGTPELRLILCTNDAVSLEADLHKHFDSVRIHGVAGTEWFRCHYAKVAASWRDLDHV